jgi:hypothetical protein
VHFTAFVHRFFQTRIGVKAGLSFSQLAGQDVGGGISGRTGYYLGGNISLPLGSSFNIIPEVQWSHQGYSYQELGGDFRTAFDYINILLPGNFEYKGFGIETGPQLGLLVRARRTAGTFGNEDLRDEFKTHNLSWIIGLGYRIPSGYGVNLRYTIGLGSISSHVNTDAHFNVFSIGISRFFGLGESQRGPSRQHKTIPDTDR